MALTTWIMAPQRGSVLIANELKSIRKVIRIFGAAYWRKGKALYEKEKKIVDNDMPIGKLTRVPDFLPPPEELFPKEKVTKITIAVDVETVAFFKKIAKKHGTKYQRMMREVLKGYASMHSP